MKIREMIHSSSELHIIVVLNKSVKVDSNTEHELYMRNVSKSFHLVFVMKYRSKEEDGFY